MLVLFWFGLLMACGSDRNVTGGPPQPALVSIRITPGNVVLEPGFDQAFAVEGTFSNATTAPVSVSWSATGGDITSAGMYTAPPSEGSFTVVAMAAGGITGQAAVTVILPPLVDPAFVMDFMDYSTTLDLRAAIIGGLDPWLDLNNAITQISLVTGQGSAPGVNTDRFMRYTWPGINAGAQDYTIRAIISQLPAGRELWIDVWSRFSDGWRNGPTGGPLFDYKYMIVLNNGGSRFNVQMLGNGGDNTQFGYPGGEDAWTSIGNGAEGQLSGGPIDMSNYWDGNWHRFRYHLRLSATANDPTGIATWYIDGRRVHRGTGLQTTPGSGFFEFNFGANMNNAVDQVQTLDWAILRIYTASPGWGF